MCTSCHFTFADAIEDMGMNEAVEKSRQIALDILQPSRADLERGLALHEEALVFESYGFSPRAAVDGDTVARMIEGGAGDEEVGEVMEEMLLMRMAEDAHLRAQYIDAFDYAGVDCILQNAGEECQMPTQLLKRLGNFTYVTDMLSDAVVRAATPDAIVEAKRAGKRSLYLSANGVPLAQEWKSTVDELRFVRVFSQLGVRMMHLTYNRRNMIGDGCAEPADGGLSDFGRSVVKELNRVGVIADIAHSGWQTSLETAQVSEKPMVASHTTCAELHRHIRSKPDEVIKAIADTDGYVGIACIPSFLGGSGDISVMLDHIAHVRNKFGARHVAIGTDVAYTSRNASAERKKSGPSPRFRTAWRSLWPAGSLVPKPQASLSMAWTNWPLFTIGLVQRGFRDDEIRQILGGNVMRLAQAVLTEPQTRLE